MTNLHSSSALARSFADLASVTSDLFKRGEFFLRANGRVGHGGRSTGIPTGLIIMSFVDACEPYDCKCRSIVQLRPISVHALFFVRLVPHVSVLKPWPLIISLHNSTSSSLLTARNEAKAPGSFLKNELTEATRRLQPACISYTVCIKCKMRYTFSLRVPIFISLAH